MARRTTVAVLAEQRGAEEESGRHGVAAVPDVGHPTDPFDRPVGVLHQQRFSGSGEFLETGGHREARLVEGVLIEEQPGGVD
jgi:hypothetical protein